MFCLYIANVKIKEINKRKLRTHVQTYSKRIKVSRHIIITDNCVNKTNRKV